MEQTEESLPSQASFRVSGINLMIQNFGFLPSEMKIYKLQMSFIINNIFIDSSILEADAVPIKIGADYVFNYETSFNGYSRLASIELCS